MKALREILGINIAWRNSKSIRDKNRFSFRHMAVVLYTKRRFMNICGGIEFHLSEIIFKIIKIAELTSVALRSNQRFTKF